MKKITLLLSIVFVMAFGLRVSAQFSCDTAVPITDAFTAFGITTPGTGGVEDWNDPNPITACAGSNAFYWDDDVYLYQYTAGANDEEVSMTIFTRNTWNGIGVFSDCTGTALDGCLSATTDAGGDISKTVLTNVGAGTTVYIAIGQWGTPDDLDFDVTAFSAIPLVDPPSCSVVTVPVDGAIDVLETEPIAWSQATGGATGYYVSIGTSSGGTDVLDNFDVGNVLTYTPSPSLAYSTEHFVTITAYNSNGSASGCLESSFTMRDAPPEGSTCGNPIIVTTALPYSTNDDTSNYGDDYGGTAGTDCGSGSDYLNGDDVVYAYSPTTNTSIDIELSSLTANYAGLFVYTDCANIGALCQSGGVNQFSTDDIFIDNFTVIGGQTYYIVISTWAAPQSVGYTLNITENTCVDPVVAFNVRSDCENTPQFYVDVDVTDLGSAGNIIVSDDQGSTSQTISSATLISFGPFANSTPVVVSVTNDDDGNCTLTSSSLTQDYCLDNVVDCNGGPINTTFCYFDDIDDDPSLATFTYTSSDGSALNITFNEGQMEGCCDELVVIDSDGIELFNANQADVSGLTWQSSGDTISWYVNSDFSASCESNNYTPFDVTVSCATCVNPIATYSVVSNCAVGPEFFVDVDVTDLGSAGTVSVSDNQGSAIQTVSTTGIVTFGPYVNNIPVVISVNNDDDVNCEISSSSLTQEFCLNTIVDCNSGQINAFYCYENDDINVFTYTSTDGTALNLTINTGEIEGTPYDFLVITDGNGTELYNGEGNNGVLDGLTFQSPGDTITIQIASDNTISCSSGSFPDGIDYTVSCATCINPEAIFQVIDDCANGQQFLVDVNVTTLGDATSLTVSNNIDANMVSVNAIGIYQVGPFPFGVDVIITLSNDQDLNCVINSSIIQLQACPPDNDNPCDATIAQVNTDDSCTLITSGTLLEATESGVPNGSCMGDADDDVWFEFTALNNIQTISILNINGGGFFQNIDHAVYEGTCDAPIELYCSDAEASVTPTLTVGNTYYVRVFSADSDPVDYTFDLCIRPGSGNVLIDQSTYTVVQLVENVLINSPCAQISNITFSTGTDFGEDNGIGYFSNPDGGFPFEEGLLLTSGDASQAAGPNSNFVSSGTEDWLGDADLSDIVGEDTNNATIIEFDFVPLNNELSFDFLMASEEYDGGFFECDYSDAFAFLLTDSNSVTTNLAVVPGTADPILVTNIHPNNGACPAINEEYFGEYIPDNLPPISFDGRTAVFTAFSPVNIGETYHIKLVIADARDSSWDSGVFLKAGSFDIGEVDLGGDITIAGGNAVCEDQPIILDTSAPNVAHVWYKDNFVIDGEVASTLSVTEEGLYTVQIIFSPQCIITDEVIIEFLPNPVIANTPEPLMACSTTNQAQFNLSLNDTVVLGTQDTADFTVTYHDSQGDADISANNIVSPYINESNPQTIFVRIEDNLTGCYQTTNFEISTSSPTHTAESVDLIGCDNDDDGFATFYLSDNDANVLSGQDASQFIVTYHATAADAMIGTGVLVSPYISSGETVFVRVETIGFSDCYVTNSFDLMIGTEPLTSFTTNFDYEVCPDATVPILITATPENYTEVEVTINWYLDNGLIYNENGLTLPVIDAGDYEIEVVFNDTGCSNSTFITVIELDTCVIPQGISPNNDGLNETFDLSSYGVTKLKIYNRNGTLVYSKTNYTNEWFGQTNDGDELPVGTYFYTMEYQNGKKRSAWIYIQREN